MSSTDDSPAHESKPDMKHGHVTHKQYHERVGRVRERFALSQKEMAKRVGISLRAYQNYERGEREISVTLVHALLVQFRVDPVWLLTGLCSPDDVEKLATYCKELCIAVETYRLAQGSQQDMSAWENLLQRKTDARAALERFGY